MISPHVFVQGDDGLSLQIDRDGVYTVSAGGEKEEIQQLPGAPIKKLDGLFYKPVGPSLSITFENHGMRLVSVAY